MKYIFNILEKIILILSIICIIILLNVQFFSYGDNYTIYTSKTSKNYENIFLNKNKGNKKGIVVLENMTPDYKEIEILLNGESIGNFSNNNEISFFVYNNDIIEIDATKYNNDIIIKIIDTSNNLELPKLDTILTTSGDIKFLGRIHLK